MSTIVTRAGKGSPLTNAEVDANFTNLNVDKLEASALSPYLLSADAASTYQTVSGMSSYLTTSSASSTYLPLSGGTLTGNVTLSGTGRRILGDFSDNVTQSNRVMFQSSTTNGVTLVSAIPNGTNTTSRWLAYNKSDPTNANALALSALSTDLRVATISNGTSSALPMTFYMDATEAGRIDTSGRWLLGFTSNQSGDKLQVSGSVWSDTQFSVTGASGNLFVGYTSGDAAVDMWLGNRDGSFYIGRDKSTGASWGVANANVLYGQGANPTVFFTNGTDRGRITATGNWLIGTATDDGSNKLQVSGNITAGKITSTQAGSSFLAYSASDVRVSTQYQNQNGAFYVGRDGSAGGLFGIADANFVWATSGSGPLVFGVNGSEAARFVASTRNLLVGTTTDDATNKLQVAGGAAFTGDSKFTSTGALQISSGTTAQRPTGGNGMLRYNSTTDQFEGYAAGAWGAIAGSGGASSAKAYFFGSF